MIIELGKGDGTFVYKSTFANPANGAGLLAADFNSDGNLDLAMIDATGITIYFGNGDGTLTKKTFIAGSTSLLGVADFNNDGIPDMVTSKDGYTINVLLGNGDGTFNTLPSQNLAGSGSVGAFLIADFNGDGLPDIAETQYEGIGGNGYFNIMLGNGDGTFTAATVFQPGPQRRSP